MISGGFSLEVFKQWAPSEKNLVTLPGYCVAGTVGHKLMSGKPTRIDLDDTCIDVRCQIHQMSFSPHTDAKGIMDLTSFLSPKHVILVHGEKPKMAILKGRIESELGIPCFYPANNEAVSVPSGQTIKVDVTKSFLRNYFSTNLRPCISDSAINHEDLSELFSDERTAEGILMMEKNKIAKIVSENDLLHTLDAKEHIVQLAFCCPVKVKNSLKPLDCSIEGIKPYPGNFISEPNTLESSEMNDALGSPFCSLLELLLRELKSKTNFCYNWKGFDHLQFKSFQARICLNKLCSYRIEQGGVTVELKLSSAVAGHYVMIFWPEKVLSIMREVELDISNIAFQMPDQVSEYMEM